MDLSQPSGSRTPPSTPLPPTAVGGYVSHSASELRLACPASGCDPFGCMCVGWAGFEPTTKPQVGPALSAELPPQVGSRPAREPTTTCQSSSRLPRRPGCPYAMSSCAFTASGLPPGQSVPHHHATRSDPPGRNSLAASRPPTCYPVLQGVQSWARARHPSGLLRLRASATGLLLSPPDAPPRSPDFPPVGAASPRARRHRAAGWRWPPANQSVEL